MDAIELSKLNDWKEAQKWSVKELNHFMECEIDCIKNGNTLTPVEQDIAIKALKNFQERYY